MNNVSKIKSPYLLTIIFGLCVSADSKITKKWVTAEPDTLPIKDTLFLSENEINEYSENKHLGQKLSNIGLVMYLASFPTYWLVTATAPDGSRERKTLEKDIFNSGALPFWALTMAIGNIKYKQAAKMDHDREYSITTSWLPYFVSAASVVSFSILANKVFFTDCYTTTPDSWHSPEQKCDDNAYQAIFSLSTLATVPWMRFQFFKSRVRLDGLEIRPMGDSKKVSLKLGF